MILTNLKKPGAIFSFLFFQILQKDTYNHIKPNAIFHLFLFEILKKHTYKSQKTWRNFLLIPFSKIKKKHTYESEKIRRNFLVTPFSNLKKAYLQTLKNVTQFFADPFFKYSKSILTNSKKPGAIFWLFLFQILKKHTYKS